MPATPSHSRHPSGLELHFSPASSPAPHAYSRRQSNASRRSNRSAANSISSINTPTSPNRRSLMRTNSSDVAFDDSIFSAATPAAAGNGMGNLADELAGAWSDEEEGEVELNFASADGPAEASSDEEEQQARQKPIQDARGAPRDSGVSVSGSPTKTAHLASITLTPPAVKSHKQLRRADSAYDGSDYGSASDIESDATSGLDRSFLARVDAIESLARRGTEDNGSSADNIVDNLILGLRDLSSQQAVELGASRLITAHSAVSTHMAHTTRTLYQLTYPLVSPFHAPPSEETIDDLLPLLHALGEAVPRPAVAVLDALEGLYALTRSLREHDLVSLQDSLHMSRQTTTSATRSLKSAREKVEELRREDEAREEAERYLRRGGWEERLRVREAEKVTREVVGGFEEVCEGWRRRLFGEGVEVGVAV